MEKNQTFNIDEYVDFLKFKNSIKNIKLFPGLTDEIFNTIKLLMKQEIKEEITKLNIELDNQDYMIIYLGKDPEFEQRLEKDFPQIF